MAKQPRVGFTKTRLCPPFELPQAAEFYEALLLDTFSLGSSLPGIQLAAAITPALASDYFERITAPGTLILPIEGADIGECLAQATGHFLAAGYHQVIALNADGPSLPRNYLLQAVKLLDENDVVLGPGEDGGYYLVGIKKAQPEIFQQIRWSTNQVLSQTLARTEALNLVTALTPPWYDVDTALEAIRLATELTHLPPERLTHTRRFFEAYPGLGGK